MEWFTVDKAGLAKLLEKRGKAFAVCELIQNAWDTMAERVEIEIHPVPNRPLATIKVEDDDPDGFKNLKHAWTMFAESEKKGDPEKRGRFNLGEKLVLALCDEATIASTTGTVLFDGMGRHEHPRKKRNKGSVFYGVIRMTREELAEVKEGLRRLIPPRTCQTIFNGEPLQERKPLTTFRATLMTEAADSEGWLKRTSRQTDVTVHELLEGEKATLYEMGIPIVELDGGERWHVNVNQKVPLSLDRDNVTPAYLQTIRVELANAMHDHITKSDANQVWISAATEDERIDAEAVSRVLDERFGKKRAVFDASDPEANKQLMDEGYTIISGGALSKGQWDNVKASSLALPAGRIRPTGVQYSEDGRAENVVSPSSYTPGQAALVNFTREVAKLLDIRVEARIVSEPIALPHSAWYGGGVVTFNMGRLGRRWFEEPLERQHLNLIVHELTHVRAKDHLTREFSNEMGRLWSLLLDAEVKRQALTKLGYGQKVNKP